MRLVHRANTAWAACGWIPSALAMSWLMPSARGSGACMLSVVGYIAASRSIGGGPLCLRLFGALCGSGFGGVGCACLIRSAICGGGAVPGLNVSLPAIDGAEGCAGRTGTRSLPCPCAGADRAVVTTGAVLTPGCGVGCDCCCCKRCCCCCCVRRSSSFVVALAIGYASVRRSSVHLRGSGIVPLAFRLGLSLGFDR